jgi:hypothetical protein
MLKDSLSERERECFIGRATIQLLLNSFIKRLLPQVREWPRLRVVGTCSQGPPLDCLVLNKRYYYIKPGTYGTGQGYLGV